MKFHNLNLFDDLGNPVSDYKKNAESYGPLRMTVDMDDIHNGLIVAIRRIIIAEVPILSFNRATMDIKENTSVINNDIIKDRLYLLPIHVDEPLLRVWEKNAQFKFEINVKNNTTSTIYVTSSDISVKSVANEASNTAHIKRRLFPDNMKNLICPLRPTKDRSESLVVTMDAAVGVRYNETSKVVFKNRLTPDEIKSMHEKSGSGMSFEDYIKSSDELYFDGDKSTARYMMLEIECETRLSPMYMMRRAIDILESKMVQLETRIVQRDNIRISTEGAKHTLTFINDNYTLATPLNLLLYKYFSAEKPTRVKWIGNIKDHPNSREITIVIELAPNQDLERVLGDGINNGVLPVIRKFKEAWNAIDPSYKTSET